MLKIFCLYEYIRTFEYETIRTNKIWEYHQTLNLQKAN